MKYLLTLPERKRVGLPSVDHFRICDSMLQRLVIQEVKQILKINNDNDNDDDDVDDDDDVVSP